MNASWTRRIAVGAPLLVATLALCGCASISEHTQAYLGSPRFAATSPATVQILATEPKRPKARLGEILLSIEGNPSRDQVENKLKTAAARFGADGVFIVSDRTHARPVVYWDCWGPEFTEDWHRLVVAVAFKYR